MTMRRGAWGLALGLLSTAAFYGAYVWIALQAMLGLITLGDVGMFIAVDFAADGERFARQHFGTLVLPQFKNRLHQCRQGARYVRMLVAQQSAPPLQGFFQ